MRHKMDKQPTNSKKPKQYKSFIRFSGIAVQMVVVIYLGNLLGKYVDRNYGSGDELYTKIITMVAVILSTVLIIRQVLAANTDN
ncbi:MAG: F0F1-type ATP synthase assembly protein I [Marivirga sp.]|jgi:F0F1-type ATP synthase assembly protein I